jgi:hypothetical protein
MLLHFLTKVQFTGEVRLQPSISTLDLAFESLELTAPAEANTKAATGSIALKITFFINLKLRFINMIYSILQVFDPTPATGQFI